MACGRYIDCQFQSQRNGADRSEGGGAAVPFSKEEIPMEDNRKRRYVRHSLSPQ